MNLRFLRPLALGVVALLVAIPAASAQECGPEDDITTLPTDNSVTFASNYAQGQAFTAPCSGAIESVSLAPKSSGSAEIVILEGDGPSGSELLRMPISFSNPGFQEFALNDPLPVSSGAIYTFFVRTGSVTFNGNYTANSPAFLAGRYYGNNNTVAGAPYTLSTAKLDLTISFSPGDVEVPLVSGSLAYGTCPAALPAGRFTCAVEANGTNNLEVGQRYTVFLRVAETGRIAFRGETKPEALEDLTQSLRFRTVASDPFAFTLELVVEMGAVAAPSGEALVIGTLDFTKGAGLRAAEALTVYPNPTAGSATLRFAVAEQAEATLVVYDALGREVARPVDGAVSGVVEAAFDGSDLPAGLYVARLTTAAGTETVRLSVVR